MHNQFELHRHRFLALPCRLASILPLLPALLVCTAALHAQVGLGLAPMRVELSMAAGAQHSGALALTSDSEGAVRVVAELLDFYIDPAGGPQFSRSLPSEAPYSCRDWIAVNPMELELPKGGQALIRYTIRVPAGAAEQSYHCAVGFTTVPTAGELKAMGLKSAVRIVTAFYPVVGHPASDGSLRDLALRYMENAKVPGWQAVVSIQNRGLMYFRPQGQLDVLDAAGQVLESVDFVPLPVLPRRIQDFLIPLKLASGPGSYTLRARVDLGGDEIQEASMPVVARLPVP